MKSFFLTLLALAVLACSSAYAQQVSDSGYRTIAYIKSDGTIQDGSYRIVGYIKDDGTVQDGTYRTIGHAKGIPKAWAAFYFFFLK